MTEFSRLHVNASPLNFSGVSRPLEKAKFVFLGVPFDGTVSYKPGCRFGPASIRELSMNIETVSARTGVDLEDIPIHDLGDLNVVPGDCAETLRRVEQVYGDITTSQRLPLIAGGEHTITLPIIKTMPSVSLLVFDAHGDLRDEYLGERTCHATVMRRICEVLRPEKVFQIGIRALSRDEVAFVRSSGIHQVTALEILKDGIHSILDRLEKWMTETPRLYISLDLDVFDPAYAPAVGNPEGEGLAPYDVLSVVEAVVDERSAGLDVVELSPHYDQGQTAALACRVFFEYCCQYWKRTGVRPKEPS